ncbi:protein kinase [Nannocystis sp.]|uniref:serine/threonine-protein kinase n=1 Tax=Nannocystis sp. TaxID=1962667 RepID=UPI0025FE2B0C|nr:protein kinase [Nannocystis sp.]MBK7824323.1 protein kinase [Nannocystis sp.]
MPLALPHAFGRYTLTQRIGEGGMAEVYLAQVTVAEGLSKRVVIKKIRKELADQPEFTRMFVDEAKIALGLNHANIVQVFDFGQVHGSFYLAMELIEGVDLMGLMHRVHARDERIPVVIAGYIAHQVAAGLAHAHLRRDDFGAPIGIVHRDISPHNIMLSHAGTVKILDFGIARTAARARQDAVTRTHTDDEHTDVTIQGKIAYMSPEQAIGGPLDQRSDIYSLGVVLYEMLSGELVFRHRDRLVALEQVRTRPLAPLRSLVPELPEALAAVVDRALAREPDDRWDTARAMQSALAAFLHRADPVVDDEVLSAFVARFAGATPSSPPSHDDLTREIEGSELSQVVPLAREESLRVVLLKAALVPALTGETPPPPTRLLALARDIAYKRDAQVHQLDADGILLAFGTLLDTGDSDEAALRVALALREAVGEAAPGHGIGVALAGLPLPLLRGSPGRVDIPHEVARHLQLVASRSIDGPIMLSGDLSPRLARGWRIGPPVAFALDRIRTGLRDMSLETGGALEQAAPLLGPAGADERMPAATGRGALVGRELEQKALRDAFAEAIRTRSSRALLVVGGAGIGKRALVDRFVASLPRGACFVLRGSGQWRRRNVPLGVFLELLRDFFAAPRGATAHELEAQLQSLEVAGAASLAPGLAAALDPDSITAAGMGHGELDPLERRDRLWQLVRRLIHALAQRRPVLIVLDNLHFLDEHSHTLLLEWLHRPHGLPLLGLCTARPGPRAEATRAVAGVHTVELRELDEQARRELVLRRFEDPEDAEPIAAAILARTGGHPLFIEETLADLLRRGIVGWNPSGRQLQLRQRNPSIELPPSIEAALRARLDALAPEQRAIVDAAAVLGQSFRVDELATLAGSEPATLDRTLASLVELGMFIAVPGARSPSTRFATVSQHEVVKQSLAPAAAEALHREAAAIKLARPDYRPGRDDGPIADHLVLAGAPAEAIDPAMRAARAARDVAGNVEAYYYWSLALRAIGGNDPRPDPRPDPRHWEALLAREAILQVWGQRRAQGADIRQILQAARHSPEREVVALGRLLRFYLECGRIQRAEQLYPRVAHETEALPLHESAAPRRAELGELGCELMTRLGRLEEAEALARAALEHCPPGPRGVLQRCRLHAGIGRVQLARGRLAEAGASFEATLALARAAGHRRAEAEAQNSLGEVVGLNARYQEAVDHFQAALQIDRDLGDRAATGIKLANLGIAYTAIGVYRRAERHLRKALELHVATGHPGLLTEVVLHLGEISAELAAGRDDLAAARSLLEQAASMAADRGDLRTELRARARLARCMLDVGDPGEARSLAEQVLARGREHGLRSAQTRALHVLSRLAEAEGDARRAIALEDEAVALVHAGAAPLDGVLSIHHLGRLTGRSELLTEAAARVSARLADLRDPELRRGYLAQPRVQAILADAGPAP